MKTKYIIAIVCLSVLLLISLNRKYQVIAINPIGGEEACELKVMTWNVHCPEGADNDRQRKIAKLILKEDADFVQLNEFCLDSCPVIDSILSMNYPYRNDVNAKTKAGDIFYSKTQLLESGKVRDFTHSCIFSKLFFKKDSLYILGCHLSGNNHEGQ